MNLLTRALVGERPHGAQPAQQLDGTDEDPAELAGAAVYRAVTGERPEPELTPRLGTAAHYAFGATAGAAYGLLALRVPAITACFGTLFGTIVWAGADEGLVPLLGLSKGPREIPARVHLFSLTSHLLFGAAVEGVRRAVSTKDQNAGNQITSFMTV
jgi:putative membrane protein